MIILARIMHWLFNELVIPAIVVLLSPIWIVLWTLVVIADSFVKTVFPGVYKELHR